MADRLIDLSAVLVLIPVLLPLVVVFSPSLYLESDPRGAGGITTTAISFGPAGSMWLAAASILIAAWALGITVWVGGRIRWWSCGFIAAGIVPCIWHMPNHFTSRLHGGAWIAAASLGLAAAHLAQFDRARRLIIAALIALALPLFIHSAWYVYAEHPATVQTFHQNLDQSLAMRGLTPGSPQAAKYLTRLEGNDVIGAVGMSNVFGSLVAAIAVIGGVIAVAGWRKKIGWARLAAMVAVLAMGLWTLKLTQSKGAVMALGLTVGLGASALCLTKLKLNRRRVMPVLCVLFVLSGSAAVLIRGTAGPPEDHHGERSLLFRYHYWQGATRMLVDDPVQAVLGVSPGYFKNYYDTVRDPISPEVVSSTHNVFVDYAVMLGIGGIAWGLLLLGWLWQAGRALGTDEKGLDDKWRAPPTRRPSLLFGPLAAIVFLTQYTVQFPGMYAETAILWLVGSLGFVALAVLVIYPILTGPRVWLGTGLTLAAVLLLLHAQVEMTFFWDTAATCVWVVMGLASGRGDQPQPGAGDRRRIYLYLPALCLLILCIAFTFAFAEPTVRHQDHLRRAGDALRLSDNPMPALLELDQAASVIANDPTTTRWRIGLRQEIASALAQYGRPEDAKALLDDAMAVIDQAQQAGLTELSTARRRGKLAMSAYQITGDRDWLRLTEQAFTQATGLSPNGLNDHIQLADAQWQLGNFDASTKAYQRALQINDNYYLDPDTQLTDTERSRLERRIGDHTPQ
jgi:hypothetical protein